MATKMMEGYIARLGEWTQLIHCLHPLSPAQFSNFSCFHCFQAGIFLGITHTIPMHIKPLQSVPYFLPSLTVSPDAAHKHLSLAQPLFFSHRGRAVAVRGPDSTQLDPWSLWFPRLCSEILVVPSRSTRDYRFTKQTLINETGSGMTLWEGEVCTQRGPCTQRSPTFDLICIKFHSLCAEVLQVFFKNIVSCTYQNIMQRSFSTQQYSLCLAFLALLLSL